MGFGSRFYWRYTRERDMGWGRIVSFLRAMKGEDDE